MYPHLSYQFIEMLPSASGGAELASIQIVSSSQP